jgi:hypothetical protein
VPVELNIVVLWMIFPIGLACVASGRIGRALAQMRQGPGDGQSWFQEERVSAGASGASRGAGGLEGQARSSLFESPPTSLRSPVARSASQNRTTPRV